MINMAKKDNLDLDVYNFGRGLDNDECILYMRRDENGTQYTMSGDIVFLVASLCDIMLDDKSGDLPEIVAEALAIFLEHQEKIQLN